MMVKVMAITMATVSVGRSGDYLLIINKSADFKVISCLYCTV